MLAAVNERRRAAIGMTLANRAGGVPSALAVAESTLAIWQQISARLEPVIGAGGVKILFWRALMLTGRKFPWLTAAGVAGDTRDGDAMFAGFRDALKSRDPVDAAAAGCAQLVMLTELLDMLVGVPMTESSLGELWSPRPGPQEPAREVEGGC